MIDGIFVERVLAETIPGERLAVNAGFDLPDYDSLSLSYSGELLSTVTYRKNGSVVATVTCGYTGGKLTSVTRS
jgi:hypothetical protein